MASNPRLPETYLQAIESKLVVPSEPVVRPQNKFKVRQLQDALWSGAAMTSMLWNYRTKDWVTGIQATDIDSDGDIEVIFSSRDGAVRAYTPWGAEKWDKRWKDQSISALFAIPVSIENTITQSKVARQACVIVGMRDGNVYAVDQFGDKMPDWHYAAGWMVRQIYIHKDAPNIIIIGSEDRHIHLLDRVTGKPLWTPYQTNGWIRCVFSCDLDGDHKPEILAGSGDEHLYLLDTQGRLLSKLYMGHQIYALFAAPLGTDASWIVLTSSNRNALYAWKIQRGKGGKWHCQKEWEIPAEKRLFDNRIHTIYVHDINKDGKREILLGSEDGCLYILDQQGSLLWKRRFGSCIYNIWVEDINYDGLNEVLIGTEDNGVYVVQVELGDDIYTRITTIYAETLQDERVASRDELTKFLTPREKAILKDIIDDLPPVQHVQMEVETAIKLMEERHYEQALALFLRARRQSVQYCWSQPVTTHGYIWTLGIGQIEQAGQYDLIVGTDEGYIYAIDAKQGSDHIIWEKDVQNRVRMVQISKLHPNELDSIVAVLANQKLVILNHKGEKVKEHLFPDKEDRVRCLHVDTHNIEQEGGSEILLGLENQKITVWDVDMEQEQRVISTPQGISILSMASLHEADSVEIIGGSTNNQVYAYDQNGILIWTFQAQDRIHALHVEDVDKDGAVEIIVGSEDRNIYVLDHEGHLKWRYRTDRGVLDVTVCDIKRERDPEEAEQRGLKILASSADGYMHVLTAYGDLLWKHKSGNRIRAVRARDLNNDGKVEVAIASANHLELLQVLNQKEIYKYIQTCWDTWITTKEERHKSIMELTYHSDEYIRAFALTRLASQHQRYDDDIQRLQEALRSDESQEVKRELVRSAVLLLIVPTNKEENARQARYVLRLLSADPDPEIRLEIVNTLPKLQEIDEGLCFEYIEYFTHNADPSVRRATVRRLYSLVDTYPERVFHLLLKTVQDKEEWIRQETGRVLAHYFDIHPELIIRDSLALLAVIQKKAPILEQISYAALHPAIKRWFSSLVEIVTQLNRQNVENLLDEAIEAIRGLQEFVPLYGGDFYQIYTEFRRILQIRNSSTIARYQWVNTAEGSTDQSYEIIDTSLRLFDEFQEIAETMRAFERREAIGDRVTSLIMATDKIEEIRKELQQKEQHYEQVSNYTPPEIMIFKMLLDQQYQVIKAEINRLRGNARLTADIRNKEVQREEEVVVSLRVSNTGVSPADNVKIQILEVNQDFTVIGEREKSFIQLPTGKAESATFSIKPLSSAPRLKFQITYDDAEKRGKQEEFADIIYLQDRQKIYEEIENPYTSGTPIRDRKMFYGRSTDINALIKKLSSITANKVVVLSGQRRMGKTSLVYQLANELTKGPHVPIIIDLQGQTLDTMGHLFTGLALGIGKDIQKHRQITIEEPDKEAFAANPIEAFDAFLDKVFLVLRNEKLVFLLDEFEHLQEKINKGPLNEDVLHYLRSLMQHRQGLNFLLVGAPRIRQVTEPLWSIFFNISVQHRLSKLEPDEADALIVDPIRGYLEYDMLALERMHKLSGDLPYFIHVLSEGLITYCNRKSKAYVTINDINNVLDIVLEEQASSISWIWNQPSSALGRFLLSILAQDKGEDGRIFTLSDIATEFDAQGMAYEQEKVIDALKNLTREDLIDELSNGTQFRLPTGLVKEWLRKFKPPERVIREEFSQ